MILELCNLRVFYCQRIHTKSIATWMVLSVLLFERQRHLCGTLWGLGPRLYSYLCGPWPFLKGMCVLFLSFFFFAALNHPHKDLLKLKLLKLKPNQSVNLELGPLLCWPWRCTVNCLLGCGSSSPAGQLGFPCFSLYVDCFSSPTCSPCIAGLSVTILLPSLSH